MRTAECGAEERGSGHRHRARRRGRHTAAILPSHRPSSILQLQPLSSSSSSRVCSLFFHFIRRMNTDVSHFEISCPLLSSILQYSVFCVPAWSLYYEAVVIVTSQRTPMVRWRHCCSYQDIIFEHFEHTIKFKYQDIY